MQQDGLKGKVNVYTNEYWIFSHCPVCHKLATIRVKKGYLTFYVTNTQCCKTGFMYLLLESAEKAETEEGANNMNTNLLTVLKFGKSPTAELLSTGKDIKGLISSEGCIIRVGARTRAGSVVVWHVLPAKNKPKTGIHQSLIDKNALYTHTHCKVRKK